MELLSNKSFLEFLPEDVIYRLVKTFKMEESEIIELFHETKKFLALSTVGNKYIISDIEILDEVWHTFIIFMSQYQDFCMRFFGKMIIHTPTSKKEYEEFEKLKIENPEEAKNKSLDTYLKLVELVYDNLGHDTVVKWFKEYPVKYSKKRILELRK